MSGSEHNLGSTAGPSTASDCFSEAEVSLEMKIPDEIKKLLILNGYNNHRVIAGICDQDVNNIENFARHDLPNLISKEKYEEYFGIYSQKTEAYKILSGHRKVIKLISEYYNNKINSTPDSTRTSTRTEEDSSSNSQTLTSDQVVSGRMSTERNASVNLRDETLHVSQILTEWIQEKCGKEKWNFFKEKVTRLQLTTKIEGENQVVCEIKCYCRKEGDDVIKIYKRRKNVRLKARWICYNFHRHFLLHLKNMNEAIPGGKRNCTSTSTSIRKYLKPVEPEPRQEEVHDEARVSDQNFDNIQGTDDIYNDVNQNVGNDSAIESTIIVDDDNQNFHNGRVIEGTKIIDDNSCQENDKSMSPNRFSVMHNSKWTSPKYQRRERLKRKREKEDHNQLLITSFFPYLDKIGELIKTTPEFGREFVEFYQEGGRENDLTGNVGNFDNKKILEILLAASERNCKRNSSKNRYDEVIKKFALYLFYIGGRLLYETLHSNLKNVLPSISCLERYVRKDERAIEEGVLDFTGLKMFLESRSLPNYVWISEDATRITEKVEYDEKTNRILGFVLPLKDGMPVPNSYIATSAKAIQNYFTECSKSSYAYVIMAQPLADHAPAYCLGLFGTDNKFTSQDVKSRWRFMKQAAKDAGINIAGFSSDGDSRLLSAMLHEAVLPISDQQLTEWPWFHADLERNDISFVQDSVHIATKFRTRLLKPSIVLPMGKFVASVSHLKYLINNFSKDQHLMVMSDIKPEDKMNYEAAEKMCSPVVRDILKEKVYGSDGTVAFLNIMYLAITAFLQKDLPICERLYNIWYAVFFLRIWRQWLRDHPQYKLKDNFISSSLYSSVELNAHSLIKVIKKFRENNEITKHMFLPWMYSSQPCERLFRATRSMTSTFSTIVNYSIKDFLRKISRIQVINNIITDLDESFVFPREQKKRLHISQVPTDYDFANISDESIKTTVERALTDCLMETNRLGINVEHNSWNFVQIPLRKSNVDINLESNSESQLYEDENEDNVIDRNVPIVTQNNDPLVVLEDRCLIDFEKEETAEDNTEIADDVFFNLCNNSPASFGDRLHLKDYSHECMDLFFEKSRFVGVSINNKTSVIRKSSLCWLLNQNKDKVSTDRLRRFIRNDKSCNKFRNRKNKKYPEINIGDWCLFTTKGLPINKVNNLINNKFLIGHILSFGYLEGPRIKPCSSENVLVNSNRNIVVLCSWYSIDVDGSLKSINLDHHFFCKLSNYKITISQPLITGTDESDTKLNVTGNDLEKLKSKFFDPTRISTNKKKCKVSNKQNKSKYVLSEETSTSSDFELDDSTSTEIFSSSHHSDDDLVESEGEALIAEDTTKNLNAQISINVDDYVIVELTTEKKMKKRFIGKIVSLDPYHCKFLKLSSKVQNAYIFVDNDEGDIDESEIIVKLTPPSVSRRGHLTFDNEVLRNYMSIKQ